MNADAIAFWSSPAWRAYEAICQVPISRIDELARATWQTQVVDLSQDETALWRGVRKSYKSLIRKAEREYRLRDGSAYDVQMPCRHLHFLEARRHTRPAESWQLMAQWVENGHGYAVVAWSERPSPLGPHRHITYMPLKVPRAFVYFLIHRSWAYYASAASLEPTCSLSTTPSYAGWSVRQAGRACDVERNSAPRPPTPRPRP